MKLKAIDGKVTFLMVTGKDLVKSQMPIKDAEEIVKKGKIENSKLHKGFPMCVDNTYFFEAVETEPKTKGSKKSVESE